MSSNKIQTNQFSDDCEIFSVGKTIYITDRLKSGKFGLWKLCEGYSQTTGQTMRRGERIRRWDTDAKDSEGKFATFQSVQEAEAYARKWLMPF